MNNHSFSLFGFDQVMNYNNSMKKRLAFFANDLRIGGIENALVNLLNMIDYHKYDVTLFLERKTGELLKQVNENVDVREYRIISEGNVLIRKFRNFFNRLKWSLSNRNKYDFSCAYVPYSFMACKLAKICSSNSSIYVHTDYTLIYENKDFHDFFDKRDINGFRKVFFVSANARDAFLKEYTNLAGKTIVCNNFVDYETIRKKAEVPIPDEKEKDVLLVFVGRLEDDSKKVGRLLETVKYLKSYKINAEAWIIGDGPDRDMYEKYVTDNELSDIVSFKGMQSNPYPYMKKADYIVLTSDYEGYPVVYLESLCLGKKLITTIDVNDEMIFIPDNYGYIVSKDVNKMKEQVRDIMLNDNLDYQDVDMADLNRRKMSILEIVFNGED